MSSAPSDSPPSPGVRALTERLRERFGASLRAVVLYGSVLRDGTEEGRLLDLMAVVDDYRSAYRGWRLALLNSVLPPNVFYLEAVVDGTTVRCKFAVIAQAQLARHVRPRCLQVYFWGRLAQPVRVVWVRDQGASDALEATLDEAATTFVRRAAPLVADGFGGRELWIEGLRASYSAELRAERRGTAARLFDVDAERYRRTTARVAAEEGWAIATGDDGEPVFTSGMTPGRRWRARQGWRLRRLQGKVLHLLRLMKAAFTFDGGVDYLLWKIERHSGVKVEVSDRVRRHPLLAGWPVLWELYRRGGFR